MVDGGMVDRGMMDGGVIGGGLVDRGVVGRGLVGSGMVGSRLVVRGRALVLDVHHVARVGIGSVVVHNLGAAIGEEDAVVASSGVAIALLIGTKLNVVAIGVRGINTILVSVVGLGGLVLGLMVAVAMMGGMVGRGVVSTGHSGEGSNEDEALHVDGIVLFDQLMLKPRSPLLL